jgi:hypothetical protein
MLAYRGWTLTQDPGTKLWTARRGQDVLPTCSRTGTLRAIIDSLTGPEIQECCTGEACNG